jgi:hypothetical protein
MPTIRVRSGSAASLAATRARHALCSPVRWSAAASRYVLVSLSMSRALL